MTGTSIAYIGIGSNLDLPIGQVRDAIRKLEQEGLAVVDCCSSLYHSAPVGDVDQPDFVNAVCRVTTNLSAESLLLGMQQLEADAGRMRDGRRWGPRVLDLDLLLFDSLVITESRLTLPHPRMHERAFVLYPLREIAPDIEIPGHGPISQLMENCVGQVCNQIDPDSITGKQASSDQPA